MWDGLFEIKRCEIKDLFPNFFFLLFKIFYDGCLQGQTRLIKTLNQPLTVFSIATLRFNEREKKKQIAL